MTVAQFGHFTIGVVHPVLRLRISHGGIDLKKARYGVPLSDEKFANAFL
jgi:hypothetical protein